MSIESGPREPCLWLGTLNGNKYRGVQRYALDTDGKPKRDEYNELIIERVPAKGMDEDGNVLIHIQRYETVLKADGNQVFHVLTCGAGQTAPDASSVRFAKYEQKVYGWIPTSRCPVAMSLVGDIHPNQLKAKHDDKPCHGNHPEHNPCRHYVAERDARRAKNLRDQGVSEVKYSETINRFMTDLAAEVAQSIKPKAKEKG